ANAIAAALAALGWLVAYRQIYRATPTQRGAPLLAVQVSVLLAGNAVLLLQPLFLIVRDPANLAPQVAQAGHLGGWLSLLLAVVVGGWYAGRALAQAGPHVLCGLGLAAGVLGACTAAHWGRQWLTHPTLPSSRAPLPARL